MAAEAPSSTELGQLKLMMENLLAQFRLLAENVVGIEDRVLARLEPRFTEIELRLDSLELAVLELAKQTQANTRVLADHTLAIYELRAEVRAIRAQDEVQDARLDQVEGRVTELEHRLGIEPSK